MKTVEFRAVLDRLANGLERHDGFLFATLLSIFARLAYLWLHPIPELSGDAIAYQALAASLAQGDGYTVGGVPVTHFMPGYPVFLAALYLPHGPAPVLARMMNAVLIACAAALAHKATLRWFGSRAAALAFVAFSLLPALFVHVGVLYAESLAIFLVAGVVYALSRIEVSGRNQSWWLVALPLSLLVLVKAEFVAWMIAPPLLVACLGGGRILAIRSVVPVVALTALALSPWVVRNARTFGAFLPLTTGVGPPLWLSSHEPELTEYQEPAFRAATARCAARFDQVQVDGCLKREAMAMVADHPAYFASRVVVRMARLFVGSHTEYLVGFQTPFSEAIRTGQVRVLVVKAVLLATHVAFYLVALVGLVWLSRSKRWWFLTYLVLTKVVIHGIIFSTPRYGLHLTPILATTLGAILAQHLERR